MVYSLHLLQHMRKRDPHSQNPQESCKEVTGLSDSQKIPRESPDAAINGGNHAHCCFQSGARRQGPPEADIAAICLNRPL